MRRRQAGTDERWATNALLNTVTMGSVYDWISCTKLRMGYKFGYSRSVKAVVREVDTIYSTACAFTGLLKDGTVIS